MAILSKKYDITEPAKQAADIDELFRDLYEQLRVSFLGATIGAAGSFVRSTGSAPVWSTLLLPNAATIGDIPYAGATNSLSMLADVATGNALLSGGVGVAPAWGKVDLTTTVTGILPLANGGTGLGATYTQGDLLYFNSGTTLSKLAKSASTSRYLSNGGASNNPSWAQVDLTTGVTGLLPYANLVNATAASLLLGRGSAGGGGAWQELTLGANLTLTGTVLSASGGGGGSAYSVLTNGNAADPELIFDSFGDVIMLVT